MSTETIVNQVRPTSHYQQEAEKLGIELPDTDPGIVVNQAVDSSTVTPVSHIQDETIFEEPELEPSSEVASTPLDSLRDLLTLDNLFKKQVIEAFKHLGLDTKRHFGV